MGLHPHGFHCRGRADDTEAAARKVVALAPRLRADGIDVRGVRLDDGTELTADLVVIAAGRRSALSDWLVDIGCDPVQEEVDDTGIVYYSRFYRLRDGAEYPERTGPIGGDLGYLKYGVFVGDNGTFSVTLATPTDDDVLRLLHELIGPDHGHDYCHAGQ